MVRYADARHGDGGRRALEPSAMTYMGRTGLGDT